MIMKLHPRAKNNLWSTLLAIIVSIGTMAVADDQTSPRLAEKTSKSKHHFDRLCNRMLSAVKDRESVQMLTAVLSGSQMGPGDGWFHPSITRYGWKWLAQRHHVEADGAISSDMFLGDQDSFRRLDRNGDGKIKADDFDWSSESPYVRQMSQSNQWFRGIDASSNGRLSREEWDHFFERVAGAKGFVTPDELRATLFPPPPKGAANQCPSMPVLLKGLFEGELGSLWEGPNLNSKAPDFELQTQDGASSIRLSSFREKKPVVLIFGSFT
jgi:hypothetical protein